MLQTSNPLNSQMIKSLEPKPEQLRLDRNTRLASPWLADLEAESIYILRETLAQAHRPVILYSIGKDSAVLLHLARKAFAPGPIPIPVLHIDTGWKFKEMIEFRDKIARQYNLKLIVHQNKDGVATGLNPFDHGSVYTQVMKTGALRMALEQGGYDAAIGGARRDEEKSRAKERIISHRDRHQRWDAKNQRPELWSLYNLGVNQGESVRVFPISNWTEMDIWHYIAAESIDIVPLYFAAPRPIVKRQGQLIMVDDDRFPLLPNEQPTIKSVRFRTLGCYPLTAAIESSAQTLAEVIDELGSTSTSERSGRLIDQDESASMERKKQEGYF